jgi:hypothetical protein
MNAPFLPALDLEAVVHRDDHIEFGPVGETQLEVEIYDG